MTLRYVLLYENPCAPCGHDKSSQEWPDACCVTCQKDTEGYPSGLCMLPCRMPLISQGRSMQAVSPPFFTNGVVDLFKYHLWRSSIDSQQPTCPAINTMISHAAKLLSGPPINAPAALSLQSFLLRHVTKIEGEARATPRYDDPGQVAAKCLV